MESEAIWSRVASIFISPEMVVGVALYAGYVYFPNIYSSLGDHLVNDPDILKYLPTPSLLFSGFTIQQSFKLRAPLSTGNKIFYEWPLYKYFVDRVYVCLAIAILCAASAISLWVFGKSMLPGTVALVFLLASIVSGIVALSMLLANQKVIEILELYGK